MKVDALILGGGPAGATTALLLARAGHRVMLCEAHAVLRERVCGMYLCPAGVTLLDRLGILHRLDPARRLLGMVMVAPDLRRLETYFPPGDTAPSFGLALPRPALDLRLLELAAEAGAELRFGCRPGRLERSAEGWRALLPDETEVSASVLIGADGRKSATARLLGLSLPVRRSRTAIHIERPTRRAAPPLGQMHVFDDGAYVGLDPVSPDHINVSFVCDPDALRGLPVVDFINDHIARSPHLAELIEPLPPSARPVATFPASARVRAAAVADAALVGDASGYIDPLTGEGIYAAMWTADALAQTLSEGWSDRPTALARYAQIRARQQRAKSQLCELFQGIICRPWLADLALWALARRQAVADSFIGIVGNSYSPGQGFLRMARHLLAFS